MGQMWLPLPGGKRRRTEAWPPRRVCCLLPCLAAVAGGGWSDQPGLSPVAEPSTERTAPGHASRQRPAPEAPTTRTCLWAPVPPPRPRLDAWQSPRRPAGPWAPQGGPAGPTGTSTRLQGPGGQGSVQGATEPPPRPGSSGAQLPGPRGSGSLPLPCRVQAPSVRGAPAGNRVCSQGPGPLNKAPASLGSGRR